MHARRGYANTYEALPEKEEWLAPSAPPHIRPKIKNLAVPSVVGTQALHDGIPLSAASAFDHAASCFRPESVNSISIHG